MAIQPVQNNSQNNIYALSAGTIAGVCGAFAGYNYAPRYANNLDELMKSSSDVFCKTMENMQIKSPTKYLSNYPLIAARACNDGVEYKINKAFRGNDTKVSTVERKIKTQEKKINASNKRVDKFIETLISKYGENMSIEDYFTELKKSKIYPDDIVEILKTDVLETLGEKDFKIKSPVNEDMIKSFIKSKEIANNVAKDEIDMYKNFLKLEKDGVIKKSDMLASAKKDVKPIVNKMLERVSFDNVKRFVPKKGQAKWAAIAGSTAAILTAGCVKLFGDKN